MGDILGVRENSGADINGRSRLFDVASGQGGYFTTAQADECGIGRALLAYHVKSGRFIRIKRGLYRFRDYPPSSREHVLAAWLALGKSNAVVSHESALDMLDLGDIIPDAVHLTVSRSRRNLSSLPGVRIHTASRPIRPVDKTVRNGISITSATRSILDAAAAGMAPDQIELAVRQAVERGMSTDSQLRADAASRGRRVAAIISNALNRTAT
jgi:predicted transcriptional regulator of viral defense system